MMVTRHKLWTPFLFLKSYLKIYCTIIFGTPSYHSKVISQSRTKNATNHVTSIKSFRIISFIRSGSYLSFIILNRLSTTFKMIRVVQKGIPNLITVHTLNDEVQCSVRTLK